MSLLYEPKELKVSFFFLSFLWPQTLNLYIGLHSFMLTLGGWRRQKGFSERVGSGNNYPVHITRQARNKEERTVGLDNKFSTFLTYTCTSETDNSVVFHPNFSLTHLF